MKLDESALRKIIREEIENADDGQSSSLDVIRRWMQIVWTIQKEMRSERLTFGGMVSPRVLDHVDSLMDELQQELRQEKQRINQKKQRES